MMTTRRFKEMIIYLQYKGKKYSIRAESIKPTLKMDTEEYTATNSKRPYAKAYDKQSTEFQMSKIDPEHYPLFKEIFLQQDTVDGAQFQVATYAYDHNHELKLRDYYSGCDITELSNETNDPFDAKFSAVYIR